MSQNKTIQKEDKIIIVGAAIAGLTTALALTQKGFTNITVLDKRQTHEQTAPPVPINLGANSVRIFGHLGLKDKLMEQSFIWRHAQIITPKNVQLGYLDAQKIHTQCGFPLVTTTRPHMQNTLLSALTDVEIIRNAAVEKCEQTTNGVTIQLKGGKTLKAKLLIGADGLKSTIRTYVIGETTPIYDGNISIQALIPRNQLKQPNHKGLVESFTEVVSPLGSVGYGLNSENTANIFFNIPKILIPSTDNTETILSFLKKRFGHFAAPIPDLLNALRAEDLVFYYPADKSFKSGWSKGNVTLVSDAAHPCLQYTGQGSAMGMEGAMVLANCLAKSIENQQTLTKALSNYEKLHTPRVKIIHSESRKLGKVFGLTNSILVSLRNTIMPLIPKKITTADILKIHTEKANYE